MRQLALLALTLASCLREKVPFCDNGAFCPEPLVCTERAEAPFCGTPAEVEPCMGEPDEAACALGGDPGYCEAGLCKPCDANNAACAYDTWVQMPSGTSVDLYAVHVAGPRDVYAAGKGGVIVHWDGRAWSSLPSPEAGDIRALSGTGGTLYAAAATAMYRFDGTAWTSEASAPNAVLGIACAGGCFSAGFRATVGRTTAAGWIYVENPLALGGPPSLSGVWAGSSTDVLAVGSSGTVMHWDGAAWTQQTTPGGHILLGVGGANAVGRVAGGAGTPVWLRAQGTTWTEHSAQLPAELTGQALSLRGVWAHAAHAFAVGDAGKIVHATDTFAMMPSGTNATLNAIAGSGNDVFAVGNGGVVLRYRIP